MAENNSRNSRWSQSGFANRGDSGQQRVTQNTDNRNEHRGVRQGNEQRAEQQTANRSRPIMPDYVRPFRNATASARQPVHAHQSSPPHQSSPLRQSSPPHQPLSPHQPAKSGIGGFLDKLNLKNFDLDADRALIIMMMALLQKETFDETLMLALLYIML
ncbi:MAG: hypothetical protein IIW79_06345 [Clostridia bacterium]|nr:hypothetical protein [Clostridia bacterium]